MCAWTSAATVPKPEEAPLKGKVIGIPTDKVRPLGWATQGVRIINLDDKDRVCSIA